MRRLLFVLSAFSVGFVACQCGPADLCEGTRCGPGLTCDPKTGSCVLGGTGGGLSGVGGGLSGTAGGVATGGGSTAGGTGGGDSADAGSLSCPMTCAGNAPICDRSVGRCVACTATQGCSGATPVCNRLWQGGLGKCQVCIDDNTGCTASAPFCDVTINPSAGCIGCRDTADCPVPGTVCDVFGSRSCVVNDGGFGGGAGGGGGGGGVVVWGDGGVTTRCLPGSTPTAMQCTTECPRGYVCQSGRCVLRGSSGPLQVTLRFPVAEDLDLYVVEPLPDGGVCEIFYQQPGANSPPPPFPLPFPIPMTNCGSQGWLDLDSNAACRIDNVNVENVIYRPTFIPTRGRYVVRVNYWQNCNASSPVPYEVEVRANGQTRYYCGTFQPNQASGGGVGAGRFVADFTIP
ncbi:MAG: hypothetical protein Q8S33_10980 [Myxococcales bacterium]|nr:hypothetical protein [Myxococcales bacterium]